MLHDPAYLVTITPSRPEHVKEAAANIFHAGSMVANCGSANMASMKSLLTEVIKRSR